ncbi:MAG: transglutaminase-like domain-containing protein [Candidatus Aerophobetes bacterium]|nr:transglutaminase-like domain-containing protein [Candidatus Aerophobetes bacterium]
MYRKITLIGIVFLSWLMTAQAYSNQFYKKEGEIYDFWGICRTRPQGKDGYFQILPTGFRPLIIFETLGKSDSLASKWGEEFLARHPEDEYRAKQIFEFVKKRINYIHDAEQFGYPEFAQNADELAYNIQEGSARGDCEDYAILLATLYKMAGYRSAIVLIPGHAAALVYLPGYKKSNVSMELGGEKGWIWAEATGKNNYFGWVPPKDLTGSVVAYEIKEAEEILLVPEPKGEPIEVRREAQRVPSFLSFLFIIWTFPVLVRFLRAFLRR